MELPKRYHYNPPPWSAFIAIVMFGFGTWMIAEKAMSTDRGLILGGLIEFGPEGARNFYWVVAVLCGLIALMGPVLLVRHIFFARVLELGEDAVILPYGFLHLKTDSIRYADIQRLWEGSTNGQVWLAITRSDGSSYYVGRSMFEEGKYYEEVRDYLASRAVGNSFRPSVKY
jgi:hypothetical protein